MRGAGAVEEVVELLSIRNHNYTYKRGAMKPLFMLGEFNGKKNPGDDLLDGELEHMTFPDDPLAVVRHDYTVEDRFWVATKKKKVRRKHRAMRPAT